MAEDKKICKAYDQEYEEEEVVQLCGYCGCVIKETDISEVVGGKRCCVGCYERR